MKKKVVTTQEVTDDEESTETEEGDEVQFAPLFDDIDRASKHIDKVYVRRTDPDTGFLGTMPADVHEGTISAKWGGGEYRLEAKNSGGRIVKVRTCKLAGDPVFMSESEEKRWRRQNGLGDKISPAAEAVKMQDVLLLMEERADKQRAEQHEREERQRKEQIDREERDRRQREERELQLTKDRNDREDRMRKDAEEREDRRRREAKEDEERRNTAHRQDMERMASMNATQLQQTQTFFTQLTAALKTEDKSDPVQTLLAGMQVAREMSSGGGHPEPGDFLSSLMQRLPETLAEIRKTGAAAYGELSGRKAGKPAGVGKDDDFLTITGPTATKAKAVLAKLAAEGKKPELVINRLLDIASGVRPRLPAKVLPEQVLDPVAAPVGKDARAGKKRKAATRGRKNKATKGVPIAAVSSAGIQKRRGRNRLPHGTPRREHQPRGSKTAARAGGDSSLAGAPAAPDGSVAGD